MSMCTRKEVEDIVEKAERRLELKIAEVEKRQNERLEESHRAISKSVSDFGGDIKKLKDELKEFIGLTLTPIINQVQGFQKIEEKVGFNSKMILLAMGALLILSPLITWLLMDYVEFKENLHFLIEKSVSSALNNYEFELTK